MDCKDAADEISTAVDMRIANGPRTGLAKAKKTLSWIAGVAQSYPVLPQAGEHHGSDCDEHVHRDNGHDSEHGSAPGGGAGIGPPPR